MIAIMTVGDVGAYLCRVLELALMTLLGLLPGVSGRLREALAIFRKFSRRLVPDACVYGWRSRLVLLALSTPVPRE